METELAGRRRGWVLATRRPLVFSSWCSSFSTTRSTAASGTGAGGPGPDGTAVTDDDDLAALPVGDPRIVLLGEVDLGTIESRAEMAEPAHLLLGQGSHFVGHDSSAISNDNVHLFAS